MTPKQAIIICLIIVAVSFFLAVYFYPQMPEQMASHWNVQGEVDGFLSKFWALFLMPIVSLACLVLFLILPKIDPLRKNIESFKNYYYGFVLVLIAFLFYLYLLTLFWNLGFRFEMARMLMPILALFFCYIGIMLKHAKRNWFLGIRTPWTLSNDVVWDKTHQLAGKLFIIASFVVLIGSLFPSHALWFIFVPVFAVVIFTTVYSYFVFRKQNQIGLNK